MRATHRSPYRMLIVAAVIALLAVPAAGAGASDDLPQVGFLSGDKPAVDGSRSRGRVRSQRRRHGHHESHSWLRRRSGSGPGLRTGPVSLSSPTTAASEPLRAYRRCGGAVFVADRISEKKDGGGPRTAPDRIVSAQDGDTDIYVVGVATPPVNVSNDSCGSSRPEVVPGRHPHRLPRRPGRPRRPPLGCLHRPAHRVAMRSTSPTTDPRRIPAVPGHPTATRYVFVTSRDGNDDIYVADGDGHNPVRLTNSPANDHDPAWSPDGTQIAFSSGLDEWSDSCKTWQIVIPSRIYVMDADGSNRRAITDGSIDPVLRHPSNGSLRSVRHGLPTDPGSPLFQRRTAADRTGDSFTIYTVDPTAADLRSRSGRMVAAGGCSGRPTARRLAIRVHGNYGIDSTIVDRRRRRERNAGRYWSEESGADRRMVDVRHALRLHE